MQNQTIQSKHKKQTTTNNNQHKQIEKGGEKVMIKKNQNKQSKQQATKAIKNIQTNTINKK